MKNLEIAIEAYTPAQDVDIIRPVGVIDNNTAAHVATALQKEFAIGRVKLVLDLSNVNYISSAGWGIFIGEIRQIRDRKGDLKLACLMPEVEEVYHVLEFHTILKAFPTIDAAVRDFK
jgi:anti-sigma B factor antagonist